jgi:DNA-directed RNA polymerase specialized sigma24 family protein
MDSSGKALLPFDSSAAMAQDPPSSGRMPVAEDIATGAQRVELQRGISAKELRGLLGRPETQSHVRAVVAARLGKGAPPSLVDDIAQDANVLMLGSRLGPRSMGSARGWVATIARRAVANHFRTGAADRKWLAPEEVDFDELPGEREAQSPDDLLLGDWLARAVAADAKDAETLEMLLYKARLEATYDEVATAHGLTSNALRCRVNAFKTKYEAEWRRHRSMLMLFVVLSAVAVALAAWVWLRSARGAGPVEPAPDVPAAPTMPTAHPSATASAPDTPFEPAAPPTATAPARTEPPRQAPAPAPKAPDTHPQRYNQFGKPI